MQAEAIQIWRDTRDSDPTEFGTREPVAGMDGVEALYYPGLPWQGRSTRVFAYIGTPDASHPAPFPGMVLVHGGGGTAFPDWVHSWTKRGVAAIAMDCGGCRGGGQHGNRPRHEWGGPPESCRVNGIGDPVGDQWMTHAVSAVIGAHNLLRHVPGIDTQRIGLTGVSWGATVACIVASVDPRLALMVTVYGCGYVNDYDSGLLEKAPTPEMARRWQMQWDPSRYLPAVHCPTLWINGTNDLAFSLPSVIQSSLLTNGGNTLSFQHLLPHGHREGWAPREIATFVNSHLRGSPGLPRIVTQKRTGNDVHVSWKPETPVARAELLYTSNTGHWRKRDWSRAPLPLPPPSHPASWPIPPSATAGFVNLIDPRGHTVSTRIL
jgi:dienelactone hydrolase